MEVVTAAEAMVAVMAAVLAAGAMAAAMEVARLWRPRRWRRGSGRR